MTRARLSPDVLKAAVPPATYYAEELPDMPTARRSTGWVLGGLCPFHTDTRAGNFRVNLDHGGYLCFACGAKGGDILDFHMAHHGQDFEQAIDAIAARYLPWESSHE